MRLPSLEPNGSGRQPVYQQIRDHIRGEIDSGALDAGERLPAIRALADDLGVNRDTVALAYESLASSGLVTSVVGRGTFVRSRASGVGSHPLPVQVALAPGVERLLAFENARPRMAAGTGAVALHSLIPDPAFYPVDGFRRAFNRAVASAGPSLFMYGGPQGHSGLRDVMARRFRREGIDACAEDLVLCHGASQGISLAVRLFAESGDVVAVEVPTYHNVLSTLVALGVQAAPVPSGPDGPDLEAVDRTLRRPEVKAFYTIPTFHNPLGTTTSLAHRQALLEIAGRSGKALIEDAFEMDLRYSGRKVPSLAALSVRADASEPSLVVHLYSFSKSLFPGLRIGSIFSLGRAIEGLIALKHATDLSDSMPLQAALAEFVRSGGYDRHLTRLRRQLRARRDALVEALQAEMPQGTTWTQPDGGYQVWVELPFEVDTRDPLPDAARAGVLFAPGSQFLPDHRPSRCLRLTVAQANEDEIRRGVAVLGAVVRERIDAAPAVMQAASVNL